MEERYTLALASLDSQPESFKQQLERMRSFQEEMEQQGVKFHQKSTGISTWINRNTVPLKLSSIRN